MKAKLIEKAHARVKEINDAIEVSKQQQAQANADFNVLLGYQREAQNWLDQITNYKEEPENPQPDHNESTDNTQAD